VKKLVTIAASGTALAVVPVLVALALILGLPAAAAPEEEPGPAKAIQPAGKDVPVPRKESIARPLQAGSAILAETGSGKEVPLPRLAADASCHNPCDDKFKLKAWVKDVAGRGVKGVKVTFSFKLESGLETGEAETDSSGYAHLHLKLTPSVAPQDVQVEATAQIT
jgi:hypothetical protein